MAAQGEVRAHLEACPDCAHVDAVEQELTSALEARLPQHPASLALKRGSRPTERIDSQAITVELVAPIARMWYWPMCPAREKPVNGESVVPIGSPTVSCSGARRISRSTATSPSPFILSSASLSLLCGDAAPVLVVIVVVGVVGVVATDSARCCAGKRRKGIERQNDGGDEDSLPEQVSSGAGLGVR
jgi:hypothetical protein